MTAIVYLGLFACLMVAIFVLAILLASIDAPSQGQTEKMRTTAQEAADARAAFDKALNDIKANNRRLAEEDPVAREKAAIKRLNDQIPVSD
jgi:hypothetical protein